MDMSRDDRAHAADVRRWRSEADRLTAMFDAMDQAIAWVDADSGQATVNAAAGALLHLPAGPNTAGDFAASVDGLAAAALNTSEIGAANDALLHDPAAEIDCIWRFPAAPTHIRVTSAVVGESELQPTRFHDRIWTFTDESALGQALDSSTETTAALRATVDAMLDPQVLLRAVRGPGGRIVDFVYLDVNRATCEYLNMRREDLIGAALSHTFPNIEGSGLLSCYVRCVETGVPVLLDGFAYDNEILGAASDYDIRAARAGSDVISLTWRDVTDRVKATAQVAESEERFRLLAENSGDVVSRVRDGRFVWLSQAAERLFGAPPEYWVGRAVAEIIPAGQEAEHRRRMRRLDSGQTVFGRVQIIGADGVMHWVHLHAKPFCDAAGHQDGAVAALRVIDDEVAAELSAAEARRVQAVSDARYRRLTENSAIGICTVSKDGRFTTVNQALCEFFGYDAEALMHKTWQQITAPGFLEADLDKVDAVLAGRLDSYRMTKQYLHADGHRIWGDLSVSCVRDGEGEVEYFISQIVDITAEVQAREKVAVLTDRLRGELDVAATYVRSLLPGDLEGPVTVSSRYLPSAELAGDCYDYAWVDDDHLIIYLLDVSGHGVASALMATSVHNLLRSASLPRRTVLAPAELLAELNRNFPTERHGENYFTIWYGVYEKSTRTLSYASAGHPAALLIDEPGCLPAALTTDGFPVGTFADSVFTEARRAIPPGSQLLLYSDGAYERTLPDGRSWPIREFVELCEQHVRYPGWTLDSLVDRLRAVTPDGLFEDDCSLIRASFS